MRVKALAVFFIALLFPSLLYARIPISRLMNLYDPNTELILEGKALKNFNSSNLRSGKPAVVPIALGHRKVLVILGPPWYVRELGVSVKKGQKIRVIGSKVYGPQGRIYIIARKIVLPQEDRSFTFRNESYIPNWRARRVTTPPPIPAPSPVQPSIPSFPSIFGRGHRGGGGRHHR